MQQRTFRRTVLAVAVGAAGLVGIATGGSPAGAATVSQSLSCGIGGTQTASLITTAPSNVNQNDTFTVSLAPNGGGTASGAEIKNMVTTFVAPTGSSIVAGSAALSGGSGTLGATKVTVSGQNLALSVPGPVANGASFTNPTLTFQLKATGAAGTVLRMKFKATGGYTLTAAGSINVSCDASPQTNLTNTTIDAVTTSSSSTTSSSTTSTTSGGSSSTTSSTSSTTTTTAPPVITTQSWSPGTACGVQESTTAPANTTSVSITAVGGHGGKGGSQASSSKYSGGTGGQAFGTFAATGGQAFSAVVGCNGADGQNGTATSTSAGGWSNGGNTGNGYIVIGQTGAGGGGGGGSTGACSGADCTAGGSGTLVVAGGGGGAGVSNCAGTPAGTGGNGGSGSTASGDGGFGPTGANGGNGGNSGSSSGSIVGGAGGVNTNAADGQGGNAPSTGALDGLGVSVVGGGGGGGYAGGKQGQNASTGCKGAAGGGGGSSWVKNTATNATFAGGTASGSVVLTFTISTPASTTTSSSTTSSSTTSTTLPPCTPDKVPFPSVGAAVSQQYKDFTGSLPTNPQLTSWSTQISACEATLDSLAVSLLPTDLTTLDDARLVRLYLAYFNRPPDPSGFAYWQRQLDAGKGLINAAKKFAESSEFKRVYGTLSNGEFIDLVYQNVLGRDADPTGRTFWLTRLDNKTKNRGDVMINFSESSENVRTKTNHVQVFRLFRSMRVRFPSKAEYFALLDPITNNGKTLNDAAKAIRLSSGYASRF